MISIRPIKTILKRSHMIFLFVGSFVSRGKERLWQRRMDERSLPTVMSSKGISFFAGMIKKSLYHIMVIAIDGQIREA